MSRLARGSHPGRAALFAVLVCLFAAGCGPQAAVVPVAGRVTLGGEPLAGATVTFQPIADASDPATAVGGSAGQTGADGRFELRLISPDVPGALPGKHRVTITTARSSADNDANLPTGERVPAAWRDGSQTFDVPPTGTTQAELAIP